MDPRADTSRMGRFVLRWWAPFVVTTGGALAILSLGGERTTVWNHPDLAFGVILALTTACAIGAAVVLGLGLARRLPEIALLGGVLWAVSLLPLTHGLLLEGHLYAANSGTEVALLAAVPAALLAGLPLLLDGTPPGVWLGRHWRMWAELWMLVPVAAAGALLAAPNLVPAPSEVAKAVVVAVSLAGTTVLSLRHLRLFALGRRDGSLLAALGFIAPGIATIAFLGAAPLAPGWWLAHLVDGIGVLFAIAGLLWAHWQDRSLAITLHPILTRDPLAALELGLTPVVHDFIADLDRKDPVTRDHVVRVAELALRAGERAGLDPIALRAVGLGGLLHDVGKLVTPLEILAKPARLSDDEREVIERHPADGEAMLAVYPHLSEVAQVVRGHHERPDGHGYPDGLVGAEIPLTASIVSVVDAWDAMTSDRAYRNGMPAERAEAILRDGTGTQWLPAAVDVVLAEVMTRGPVTTPRLDAVGRAATVSVRHHHCDCLVDILPETAAA